MKRGLFSVGAVVALLGLVGMGGRPPVIGAPAPEVILKDLRGQEVKFSDLRGQVVLVNFWATWCKPCETEMPAMEASFQKLRQGGLVILAINTLDSATQAAEQVRRQGYTFPVLIDHGEEAANRFRVRGLPTSFLIDREGIVREQIFGSLLTEERIANLFRTYN